MTPTPPAEQMPWILVAEDNEAALQGMVEAILRTKRYNVVPCLTGLDALNLVVNHRFDLLVTDNRLPGMNGIDIVKSLRRSQINIRSLMVTNWPDPALTKDALNHGVSRVLPKPIHYPTFLDIIDRTLRDPAPQVTLPVAG